jgi:hypothetical protein
MSSVVVNRANNNDQVQKLLNLRVIEVRGLIGRLHTLSDNENEVPPEGLRHVLILVILDLLSGTPNFQFLIRGPDGAESGFGFSIRQAQKWIKDVTEGMSVTYPVNPKSDYPELVRYGGDDLVDTDSA